MWRRPFQSNGTEIEFFFPYNENSFSSPFFFFSFFTTVTVRVVLDFAVFSVRAEIASRIARKLAFLFLSLWSFWLLMETDVRGGGNNEEILDPQRDRAMTVESPSCVGGLHQGDCVQRGLEACVTIFQCRKLFYAV